MNVNAYMYTVLEYEISCVDGSTCVVRVYSAIQVLNA